VQVASFLTPPQIAKRYGCDVHRVLRWIRNGELAAVNVGDGAMRPRFRISQEALEAFERRRSAGPEPKVSRVRRRRDPQVKEYF
jgi:excisionase family DNA binding protein